MLELAFSINTNA